MPRLRPPPTTGEPDKLFDSTVKPPVEEQPKVGTAAIDQSSLDLAPEIPDELEVVVEEPKKEPKQEVKKEEPKKDDAALALKYQIDALRKNEEFLKRSAGENYEKFIKSQREILDAQEIALDNTRKAAKAEADKALSDYKNALDAGDNSAAVEAMDRLTDAKANIRAFERDREELKFRKKELKKERQRLEEQGVPQAQQQQAAPTGDPVDNLALPDAEKQWLKTRREYMTDPVKAAELGWAHQRATRKGLKPGDANYLPEIEAGLDMLANIEAKPEEKRTNIVSAPVSREAPSAGTGHRPSGRITLTRDQLEAAQVAGITPAEYARQLMKLNEMKANGEYGDRR